MVVMLRKAWRPYFFVAIVLLGLARFHWSAFGHAFTAVNFPWSIVFLWLEKQPSVWRHRVLGSLVNDKIGRGLAFLLMVALQALLFTALLVLFTQWRTQNHGTSRLPEKSC